MDRTSQERIPSLDGLRAIAIALVVVGHVAAAGIPLGVPPRIVQVLDLGNLGVRIFFVLSGFLITGILYESSALGRFYLRRALRIFPAYYVYILAIVIFSSLRPAEHAADGLLAAATYTSNYARCSWDLSHSWSLSVEEQFYLGYPLVLMLAGRRRTQWLFAGLLVVFPLVRLCYWRLGIDYTYRFEAVGDALVAGCMLRGAQAWLRANATWQRLCHSSLPAVLAAACIPLHLVGSHPSLVPTLAYLVVVLPVLHVMIAFCIDAFVQRPQSRIGRVLNSSVLTKVGVASYSIYLWQQPFLNPARNGSWSSLALHLGLVAVAATASYLLIERPVQALRRAISSYRESAP